MELQDGGPSQQLKGKVWQWRGIIERAFGCRRSGPAEGHGQADVEMEGYFSVEKFGVKTPRPTCVCMLRNDRGMHILIACSRGANTQLPFSLLFLSLFP